MWISKKKYRQLEERIADLEVQVQGQRVISPSISFGGILSEKTACISEISQEDFRKIMDQVLKGLTRLKL